MKIGIVGLGQIGGSLALALAKTGKYQVFGLDKDEAIKKAIEEKIDGQFDTLDELKDSVDFLILAAPILVNEKILDSIESFGGIIMDTGSTKQRIMEIAKRKKLKFVGGHPLCGTEKKGPESWNANLFENQKFFLSGNLRRKDKKVVETIVQDVGAIPVWIEPEIHDTVMAYTSHMPYVIALALTRLSSKYADFWGPGIKSTTRLAAQNPDMAFDILLTNRKNVEDALQDFSNVLMELKILLRNPEELKNFLKEIAERRQEIDD